MMGNRGKGTAFIYSWVFWKWNPMILYWIVDSLILWQDLTVATGKYSRLSKGHFIRVLIFWTVWEKLPQPADWIMLPPTLTVRNVFFTCDRQTLKAIYQDREMWHDSAQLLVVSSGGICVSTYSKPNMGKLTWRRRCSCSLQKFLVICRRLHPGSPTCSHIVVLTASIHDKKK